MPTMMRALCCCSALVFCLTVVPAHAATFDVQQDEAGVTVNVDGQLMTRYLVKSGSKPILWPVVGPSGRKLTRGYPMRPATPDERDDHIHHRSFWFTHGSVNGVDFWLEREGKGGIIQHREFGKVEGGDQAVIVTRNDWLTPAGEKVCEDERILTFHANDTARWIDVELIVKATDGAVTFGDTKEGSFGVRVAGTMKVDAEPGGTIINCEGLTNKEAWGKRAAWVDYYGPVDGKTVGIAIMNHPTSFRFPTHWHVRTYGLFTANPFGWHDFLGRRDVDGSHEVPAGETLTLRYRVLLHLGDEKEGNVAGFFEQYEKLYQDGT
jgi:hypothetical protein